MNKLKSLFRFALGWAVFALVMANSASAQCTINTKTDGCVGVPVSFSVTGPALAGADSIVWTFGNGSSKGQSVTNLWNTAISGAGGNYTVRIYNNGVEVCNASGNITIHENPVADFSSLSPSPQCFNGNAFTFQNNSTTPSGNPIISYEFVYGDGGKTSGSGNPGTFGPYTYTPPNPAGGFFTPSLRIEDDKGCIAFVDKNALIQIRADLGVDFVTPNPTNCLFTNVVLTNTSLIPLGSVSNFKWEFGDGSPDNTTDWGSVPHQYTKDGCFNARLIVESNDGCLDTAEKQAACNVNPKLDVSVANGDVQCFGAQNYEFRHPVIPNAQSFLWTFDDPNSGQFNTDNQNWNAPHDFTGAGPYDVTFRVTIAGCTFDTVYRVHVKGPGATIETKPSPIIAPSQRYQCNITDTVFFPNLSSYYFNDDSAYNDFFYTLTNSGAIFQFIDPNKAHIDFDTIQLKPTNSVSFTTKTGKSVYQSAGGDTLAVDGDTLILNGAFVISGIDESAIDAFNNPGKHTTRVWDFADNVAPQCTTDSRPIYPKLAIYNNTHLPGPAGNFYPRNTYDANGKWVNCNFSYDSLPKHWYTPGEERCYQVRLELKDTSRADPNIQNSTASGNDPSFQTNDACESQATVQLALQGPDANGLRWEGIPCFGPANIYGFFYDFSRTGPACDREQFWIHLDSLADRVDATPNVFDKWIPQTNTVVDRMFTPWPMATQSVPPNVGRVFWQYQPNGTYPSKIASPDGWVTIGFRVQNGIDPKTGQPCIDEVWYDSAYRYINSNAAFRFNSDRDKPDSLYTFERVCAPNDVRVKRDSTFLPVTGDFTYSSDSIGVEIWNWGDGVIEIDSFARYNCIGNLCYSYRLRYRIEGNSAPVKIDSIITRIYDPALGKSTFVDARDSTPDIFREHRYLQPNWNRVGHTIIPCQRLPFDSLGITVFRNTCCDNPPFENVRIAITGFLSFLNSDDSIVCRNTPIQFFDSARYYLEFPIPVPPFIIDDYDYWDKQKQVFLNDGVTPRPRPRPAPKDYEKLRWNFDDGSGWNASVPDNPVRSFPEPGIYDVKLEYTDSFACKQVMTKRITVTGVSANFTFNRALANCRPTVDFLDTSLMIDPCTLVNNQNCDNIIKWEWDFGDNKPNNQSQSILQNPSKVYTSFGDFDVVLKVTTQLGCVDSIVRTISLEGPRPQFEFAADSVGCVPFTLELRNTSINPTPSASWTYFWGDGNFLTTTSDSNVLHTYNTPGTYEVFLLQEDVTPLGAGNCTALFPDSNFTNQQYRKFIVRVLPSRPTDFTIADSVLCVGDSTEFTSNSDTIYDTFRWVWGDGAETNLDKAGGGDQVFHQFNSAGTFYVQFRPNYTPAAGDPTCRTSAVKRVFVRDVKAEMLCDTTTIPFVTFKNLSTNAQDINWDFGVGQGFVDGSTLPEFPDAAYNYGENQGDYTIRLFVRSPEGCEDSTSCTIRYRFKVQIDPPNAFSPGTGDNFNELFDVIVENEEMYELSIFNRWGERVFFADNKDKQWDGTHMGTGSDCPAGVYFVVINYRLRGQSEKTYRGSLTLFREK